MRCGACSPHLQIPTSPSHRSLACLLAHTLSSGKGVYFCHTSHIFITLLLPFPPAFPPSVFRPSILAMDHRASAEPQSSVMTSTVTLPPIPTLNLSFSISTGLFTYSVCVCVCACVCRCVCVRVCMYMCVRVHVHVYSPCLHNSPFLSLPLPLPLLQLPSLPFSH